jgi:IclR family KDG regulon transcriptional repressor
MDSTLLKGLSVLEVLARSPRPRSVSNLAAALNLTRSNAHRTLQTLVASGFARQDEHTSGYECTLKLFELAAAMPARLNLSNFAAPLMRALVASTQETVHLSVLDGGDVVYVEKIDSPQPVRAYSAVGGRAPAYCVATGKALLASQPEDHADRYEGKFEAFTPTTITTTEALRTHLRQVRRQGFAINHGEWRATVHGLAAPVFGSGGRIIAAIGISGPADRLPKARLESLSGEVVAAARELTLMLDFPAPDNPPSKGVPRAHHSA